MFNGLQSNGKWELTYVQLGRGDLNSRPFGPEKTRSFFQEAIFKPGCSAIQNLDRTKRFRSLSDYDELRVFCKGYFFIPSPILPSKIAFIWRSFIHHSIANTLLGNQVSRLCRVLFVLSPKASHENSEIVIITRMVGTPDLIQKEPVRQSFPRVAHQSRQEFEFNGCEVNL
jgi:hypothetical protein